MLTQAEIAAIQGTDIYLEHSGIKGMRWGIRRYQNEDGSLTTLGRIHYGIGQRREAKKIKIMQSGNAKKVLKYQKHLTDEEFDQAMARVAKSEALKKVANAPKEAKKAEKAAKDAAKAAEKAQEDKVKLSKKELKSAEAIAKTQAKTKMNSDKVKGLLSKGLAVAGSVAAAYKTYSQVAKMINDLTGAKLPGVGGTKLFDLSGGGSDAGPKKPPSGDSGSGGSDAGPKKPPSGGSGESVGAKFATKKPESSSKMEDDISEAAWDMGKKAFSKFKDTSTASDTFESFVEGIGRSAANPGRERKASDSDFFAGVSEIIDATWTETKETPVSDILALPYNDKWLK